MDNAVFNINGSGEGFLAKVLALAFEQTQTPNGWKKDKEKGIVLFWYGGKKGFLLSEYRRHPKNWRKISLKSSKQRIGLKKSLLKIGMQI